MTQQPLEGATLEARRDGGVEAATTTDDAGEYQLAGLPQDDYELHAHAHGHREQAEPVDLGPGDSSVRDVTLQQARGEVVVTVTSPDDGPGTAGVLEGAAVALRDADDATVLDSGTTDGDGEVGLHGSTAGDAARPVEVVVHADGHDETIVDGTAGQPLTLDEERPLDVAVEAAPGSATIDGDVLHETYGPLGDVEVAVLRRGVDGVDRRIDGTVTRPSDGTFHLEGVGSGTLMVEARDGDDVLAVSDEVPVAPAGRRTVPVDVGELAELTVHVIGDTVDREPYADVAVTVSQGALERRGVTDADGQAHVGRLVAGRVHVTAHVPGLPPRVTTRTLEVGQQATTQVVVDIHPQGDHPGRPDRDAGRGGGRPPAR